MIIESSDFSIESLSFGYDFDSGWNSGERWLKLLENEDGSEFKWERVDNESSSTECILIVDDDENILDMLTYKFEEDYEVRTLDNGEECLTLLRENNLDKTPCLIVLDVMMPGRNGIEILKYIRGIERYDETPVIVLSGTATEDTGTQAINAGADDYINKPVSLDELEARVQRLLNSE